MEESTNHISQMLNEVWEKDPEAALHMLMLAVKTSLISEFMEAHKSELSEVVEIPMTKGELMFLAGACLHSVSTMVHDRKNTMDGQFVIHVFREFAGIGPKLAIDAERHGYPDDSLVRESLGVVAQIDRSLERAEAEYEQIRSGEKSIDNIVQGYQ